MLWRKAVSERGRWLEEMGVTEEGWRNGWYGRRLYLREEEGWRAGVWRNAAIEGRRGLEEGVVWREAVTEGGREEG